MQKIILASQSPRRKQLLQLAKVPFEVRTKDTGESYPSGLLPEKIAIHIARNKALAVLYDAENAEIPVTGNVDIIVTKNNAEPKSYSIFNTPVLAADTIVVLNNEIIGKPDSREDAINILLKLSGKKHSVITGVVILFKNNEVAFADITEVEFHALTRQQIEFYVDNYKPFDKAGAYAIQEWIGVIGIKSVNGDFYNVIGLPISRVLMELQKMNK
ncbi:MAG: septum formation protein Maf [Chitinophagaceae bacterium]|jgi:septum formation protein|nr:septum formation protein Maf [Chitinophagaceae bacterium]